MGRQEQPAQIAGTARAFPKILSPKPATPVADPTRTSEGAIACEPHLTIQRDLRGHNLARHKA